jgi:hypothetical protein
MAAVHPHKLGDGDPDESQDARHVSGSLENAQEMQFRGICQRSKLHVGMAHAEGDRLPRWARGPEDLGPLMRNLSTRRLVIDTL